MTPLSKSTTSLKAMVKQPDLFGGETPVFYTASKERVSWFKGKENYRKADCEFRHCYNCRTSYMKHCDKEKFLKCQLMGDTSSMISDVDGAHICDQFQF